MRAILCSAGTAQRSIGTHFAQSDYHHLNLEFNMLSWAIGFFIVAIIAAVFGFGGIASGAAGIAKVLFFLFLIAFVVSLIMGLMRGRGPRV
jgi:uncharacterized membrane protein YtjA (UPF0391 family)